MLQLAFLFRNLFKIFLLSFLTIVTKMSFLQAPVPVSAGPVEVTIKSIKIDEVQPVNCPDCRMSAGTELDGDLYFFYCAYTGSE